MQDELQREGWDFSGLKPDEVLPALLWEIRRERADIDQFVTTAQAWLDGKFSTQKAPMPRDKRTGKRPRYNSNFSEADNARNWAIIPFEAFLPTTGFSRDRKWSARRCGLEWDRWHAGYLRPLLRNCDLPWLCLLAEERQRLCDIVRRDKTSTAVTVRVWRDAVGHFQKTHPHDLSPLKFDGFECTSVLLTIDWSYSRKSVLAAFGKILKQIEPSDMARAKRSYGRGRKQADLLVMLERLAVMRLLHYYTLSELKRRLPDAWNLYGHQKWYDDRRRALQDFRRIMGRRDPPFFPKHGRTKADRTRKTRPLPAK